MSTLENYWFSRVSYSR